LKKKATLLQNLEIRNILIKLANK